MDELRKLEAEKLVDETEEIKIRIKNELLTEKFLEAQIQNEGLRAQELSLRIKQLETEIRVDERKIRAYDEMENYFIQMKDVAKYKQEVWFARAHKEGIKY